jgi:hypothetical protein
MNPKISPERNRPAFKSERAEKSPGLKKRATFQFPLKTNDFHEMLSVTHRKQAS